MAFLAVGVPNLDLSPWPTRTAPFFTPKHSAIITAIGDDYLLRGDDGAEMRRCNDVIEVVDFHDGGDGSAGGSEVFFSLTVGAVALAAPPASPAEVVTATGAEPPLAQAFKVGIFPMLVGFEPPAEGIGIWVEEVALNGSLRRQQGLLLLYCKSSGASSTTCITSRNNHSYGS
ncbi:hypothetical protein ACFX13_036871 [Malus domestica]